MFQFRRFPTIRYGLAYGSYGIAVGGFPIRKSPDLCLFAAPRSLSQLITSFIGSWCQGIPLALLLAWPIRKVQNIWFSIVELCRLIKEVLFPFWLNCNLPFFVNKKVPLLLPSHNLHQYLLCSVFKVQSWASRDSMKSHVSMTFQSIS